MHDSDSGLNRKMAPFCKECKTAIINKQFLVCRVCELYYHLDCTDISFQRFRIMTAVNKKNFRCEPCLSRREVQTSDLNTSPLLPITKVTKNITRNFESTLGSDASLPIPIDSSTQKSTYSENYIVNIPTENSFQDLPNENEEYASITSTPVKNNYLNLHSNRLCMEKLKEKINRLEKKLESAENNIEKLAEKNRILEKQIAEYSKTTARGETKDKQALSSESNHSTLQNNKILLTQNNIRSPTNNHQTRIPANPTSTANKEKTLLPQKTSKEDATRNKGKSKHIFILGDEQLRNLSSALLRTRLGKWNDDYQPDALIMPGATSTELLVQCEKLLNKIKNNDIVVLGIGNNDNNLHKLHSNLCIALSRLCKVTVFIVPVIKNPYLNETTLNYHLKLWTKHFENCTVIESNFIYRKNCHYINYICKKINICIDYIKYELEFLNFDCIRKHNMNKKSMTEIKQIKNTEDVSPSIVKIIQDQKTDEECASPKKGTIPYFFKRNTNTPSTTRFHNSTLKCTKNNSVPNPHNKHTTQEIHSSPIQHTTQTIHSSPNQHIAETTHTIRSTPIQQNNESNNIKTFFRP